MVFPMNRLLKSQVYITKYFTISHMNLKWSMIPITKCELNKKLEGQMKPLMNSELNFVNEFHPTMKTMKRIEAFCFLPFNHRSLLMVYRIGNSYKVANFVADQDILYSSFYFVDAIFTSIFTLYNYQAWWIWFWLY